MLKHSLSVLLLGVAALVFSATPALASGGSVSAGFTHSCAVKGNGDPVCWGDDEDGQVAIPPLTGTVTEIAGGGYHSCAIKTGGAPVCWGDNGTQQLDVPPGIQVTDISVGFTHTCAIQTDGNPVCWGRNVDSQSTVPAGTGPVTQIVAGGNHTCLIKPDGTAVCWGYNAFGQATVPPDLGPVTRIAAALYHSCAIKTGGTPVCWGKNEFGESTVPAGTGTVTEISTMGFHTCAIKTNERPVCWGKNDFGQSTIPAGTGTVTEISAGLNHTCLVKTNGNNVCWGDDGKGQLGAAPAITSAPLPATGANRPYSHTVTATGSPTPRFAVGAGDLPPGLSLNATSGQITGTPTASGTYAGTIRAANGVFANDTQPFSIAVDVDAPSTTDDGVPAGFVDHDVTVTLTAADTGGSGLAQTHYTTDGTPPTTASPTYNPASKPVLTNGQRIRYFSTDNAGNEEDLQRSKPAKVDLDAPTTLDDVPAGYVNHDVTVTLTAADGAGSGVAQTHYTTDGSTPTAASPTYDASAKPVLTNGQQIKYFSTDEVGRAEAVKTSAAVQVEITAPSSSITSPVNGATYAKGALVNAAYSCADEAGGSGVGSCAGPVANGARIDTQTAGPHTFTVTAQDNAGNSTTKTVTYTVKAPAPTGGGGAATPPPIDTTGPVIVIPAKSKKLTVRAPGVVLFRFGAAVEDTTGVISLKSTRKLGSARFSAAKDQSVVVRIKLSKKAKKALKKRKKLKVTASIAVQDAAGNVSVRVFKFTLKAAKPK